MDERKHYGSNKLFGKLFLWEKVEIVSLGQLSTLPTTKSCLSKVCTYDVCVRTSTYIRELNTQVEIFIKKRRRRREKFHSARNQVKVRGDRWMKINISYSLVGRHVV
jgi:hypothetical protein